MQKESLFVGIIGLLLGVVLTGFAAGQSVNNSNAGMMRMMGIRTAAVDTAHMHEAMSMTEMAAALKNYTGDDFDQAFIEMMIEHHEGAVEMAQLAEKQAKHDEIKQLSLNIIKAQEQEIADMKSWQKAWGYPVDAMMQMMHPR
jgi:uncharacterized protein (DUF305 family)